MKRPEKKNRDEIANTEYGVGYEQGYEAGNNESHDEWDKFLPSEKEVLRITIENTLKLNIAKKENRALVFTCCGKPIKDIRTSGLCPHCLAENTEVVELWKYNLAKAIAKRVGGE